MSMTTTQIAEGDRIYATESIDHDAAPTDTGGPIPAGSEGTVAGLTGSDAADLLIEWDAGFTSAVDGGSVALV